MKTLQEQIEARYNDPDYECAIGPVEGEGREIERRSGSWDGTWTNQNYGVYRRRKPEPEPDKEVRVDIQWCAEGPAAISPARLKAARAVRVSPAPPSSTRRGC